MKLGRENKCALISIATDHKPGVITNIGYLMIPIARSVRKSNQQIFMCLTLSLSFIVGNTKLKQDSSAKANHELMGNYYSHIKFKPTYYGAMINSNPTHELMCKYF